MRRLLSHRDARIYLAGQGLSVIGGSALWLAMGIWVKMLTGSNSAAGLTFFPFICGCLGQTQSTAVTSCELQQADSMPREAGTPYGPATERSVTADA
jgi:hypothetical protein